MRKWSPLFPVIGSFLISAAAFSRLPDAGQPDLSALVPFALPQGGGLPRLAAALLIPTLALATWLLLSALARVRATRPQVSPQWWLNETTDSSAIARFEGTYASLGFAITSLFALMHVALIGSMLQAGPLFYQLLTCVLGAGMIAAGNIMPRTRPNWIVGIRTRATMTSQTVWLRTHRTLGALWIVSGLAAIGASAILPRYALMIALGGLLVSLVLAHAIGTSRANQRSETLAL